MSASVQGYERVSSKHDPSSNTVVTVLAQKGMSSGEARCVNSQVQFPPSPADSDKMSASPPSTSSPLALEEERITRDIARGTPGDRVAAMTPKTPQEAELARKRSQFYGEAFAYREPVSSARDRVSRDSIVLCEIQTNIIMNDEYTLLTTLSTTLSSRYQRPESSIFLTLKHSACFLLAGSFDPAYIMTITALPSQVQPVTNKRNAALLQTCMEELLSIDPQRGVIKFIPLAEENYATNGKTVAGEIEELERNLANEGSGLRRGASIAVKGKKRALSTKSSKHLRPATMGTHDEHPSSVSERGGTPLPPPTPTEYTAFGKNSLSPQKLGRKKSIMAAMFGKKP
ncbi:macrophage migration inhibitory factor protein [Rutstroemia sp. NJR-2017a WRK4]|nr:macrophage migration inhibitory factor protein [Rutstroemia sp. NJR-2017a WRK4]